MTSGTGETHPNGDEPAPAGNSPSAERRQPPTANGADPPAERPATTSPDDFPIAPADVASAGRSCSAILILLAAILILLCVGTALRWIILG